MNVKKWFAHKPEDACKQLHVLRVFERTGRACEDCTALFPIIIGRGADVDVNIHDPTASRIHCGLTRANCRIVLTDLESQNGTFLSMDIRFVNVFSAREMRSVLGKRF